MGGLALIKNWEYPGEESRSDGIWKVHGEKMLVRYMTLGLINKIW